MTTDAERCEATDHWTIQLREQQLRDLRAQLDAANQDKAALKRTLHEYAQSVERMKEKIAAATQENALITREVAGLRYYIAQLERNVSQEERSYAAGIASLMLTQYDIDSAQPRE